MVFKERPLDWTEDPKKGEGVTVVGSTAGWQEGLTACERTVAGVEVYTIGKAKRVSIESLD